MGRFSTHRKDRSELGSGRGSRFLSSGTPGRKSRRVPADQERAGIRGETEPGLESWRVYLDPNGNRVFNSGENTTLIADNDRIGNLPEIPGFTRTSLDIGAFRRPVITVEFTFDSDRSLPGEGWFVDDVVVLEGDDIPEIPT